MDDNPKRDVWIFAIAGLLIVALMAWAVVRLGVLAPESGFYTGASLPADGAAAAIELGLVADTAEIVYFYSDGYFDFRERMVVVTDSEVIQYAKADSPALERMAFVRMEATDKHRDNGLSTNTRLVFTERAGRVMHVGLPDKDAKSAAKILEHVNRRRFDIRRIRTSPIETLGAAEVHSRLDYFVQLGSSWLIFWREDTPAGHVEFKLEKRPDADGREYYVYTERYLYNFSIYKKTYQHVGWTEDYYDPRTLKLEYGHSRSADFADSRFVTLSQTRETGDTYRVTVREFTPTAAGFRPVDTPPQSVRLWMADEYLHNQIEEYCFTAALQFEQMLAGKSVYSRRLYPSSDPPFYSVLGFEDRLKRMDSEESDEADSMYQLLRRRDGDGGMDWANMTITRGGVPVYGNVIYNFLTFARADRQSVPARELKLRRFVETQLSALPDP